MVLDFDATLITAHSEKEGAAGNYKGAYGYVDGLRGWRTDGPARKRSHPMSSSPANLDF